MSFTSLSSFYELHGRKFSTSHTDKKRLKCNTLTEFSKFQKDTLFKVFKAELS